MTPRASWPAPCAATRAVRRDKTNADLHFWHGVSLYALGEAAAAQAEWQQTVQLAPAHPYATHLLAMFASAQSPAHTTEVEQFAERIPLAKRRPDWYY